MIILHTERLVVRQLTTADAPFILELLNDPAWLQFIGDKGVRTVEQAVFYLENGPLTSYRTNGFGLWLVSLKEDDTPIGMCGLIKRDILINVDIGFAYLPQYGGKGYAYEAARAVLDHAKAAFGLDRMAAIVNPDNARSLQLLAKLGFLFRHLITLPGEEKPILLLESDL